MICAITVVVAMKMSWKSSIFPPEMPARFDLVSRPPNITPDYSGIVLPPNIAPMNFTVREEAKDCIARIHSDSGEGFVIAAEENAILIPIRKWRKLLNESKGRKIFFDLYLKNNDDKWLKFEPITNTVAKEDIDPALVFRFMKTIYNAWKDIGIYQRNLTNYDVSLVLHGRSFGQGCVNCHSFPANNPDTMTIALRSRQ